MINELEKNKNVSDCCLCLITPPSYQDRDTLIDQIVAGISGGVDMIQLRDKRTNIKGLIGLAKDISETAHKLGALFIVNDSIGLAIAADADGVHLGQEDTPLNLARSIMGPDKIIGCSTHSVKQALDAQDMGADYIGFGPIFHSSLKKDLTPIGPYSLEELNSILSIPYFAIGGINPSNLDKVIRYGGRRVALCSAFFNKQDLIKTASSIKERLMGPIRDTDEEMPT